MDGELVVRIVHLLIEGVGIIVDALVRLDRGERCDGRIHLCFLLSLIQGRPEYLEAAQRQGYEDSTRQWSQQSKIILETFPTPHYVKPVKPVLSSSTGELEGVQNIVIDWKSVGYGSM